MFSYAFCVQGWLPRVLQAGTGGEPMVFVHGTGARADRWARNRGAVVTNKIIPGFGNSARLEPASEATVSA